ncbi:MAG TPA: F0F1 ATP synthase subunit delta, partial [Tetrasphaera sp.]|nr:F0F1 ATP synthase subunit delta [Tetrasphaera sp.]
MRGSSRAAAAAGLDALQQVVGSIDAADLAEQFFAAGAIVEGNATLRRALTDPSREGSAKSELARRL